MKHVLLLLICLSVSRVYASDAVEKELKTHVSDVTVYLEGAQETRKTAVDLPIGKTILKYSGLSPFIDAKSVQIKANGEMTVLTVNFQLNHFAKTEKSQELKSLQEQIKTLNAKIDLENAYVDVINEDLNFLKQNSTLSGKDQAVNMVTLKEGADFFSTKMTSLRLKKIEREKTITELTKQLADLNNQYNALNGQKEFATGEVLVLVETKKATKAELELTYLVSNAGWYPSYDIRAKNISEPLEIVYKANIHQDTKEDWTNVNLKLSSYNPSVSGVAPELKTYFMNYNSRPPVYREGLSSVSGWVCDANSEPLIGASVFVEGTKISTITNGEGYYSLTLPANASRLKFSSLGYSSQYQSIESIVNVTMEEDAKALDEVVMVGYGKRMEGRLAGVKAEGQKPLLRKASVADRDAIPPQQQVEKQISVDFDIQVPYTILTDNKLVAVDMERLNLPATYQYFCVPKVNKESFLIAQIMDWEKFSFLEGEANVFFEDTYVGKTIFNVNSATDTLSLSLGRDKKVSVQREKIKTFSSKQFIGSKKEDARVWKTTVRNSRNEKINMVILDQVPVSTNSEIEVNTQTTPEAKINPETGTVKWDIDLDPGKSNSFDLKYVVKYPKGQYLIIE